jgi:P4 family phage/plasmid primase-like protien
MTDPYDALVSALRPITSRVRRDKTAIKRASGRQAWTDEPLTRERLARHLNGGPARGVCPLLEGASGVRLALLDFDSHKGEVPWVGMSLVVGRVVDALALAWGASPILFRSSGGMGVHLYLLWDEEQDAYSVRAWLAEVLHGVGLKPGTGGVLKGEVEVFPRQDSVAVGKLGNQFILPMAGKGAPLVLDDLSGVLEVREREWVLSDEWAWPVSPPVPVREKPVRAAVAEVGDGGSGGADLGLLAELLDAIPNGRAGADGASDLDYDAWLRVVLAVHRETGGSPEGEELARAWSARSAKHQEEKFAKSWDHADAGRDGGAGLGSLKWEARRWGWLDPENALDVDAFSVVPEGRAGAGVGAAGGTAGGVATPVERRGVPKAKHLCTDQANANRLVKAYGSRVLVAAGRWHVWDGRRWLADESDVYRYACRLSAMVKDEAREVVRKAAEASLGAGADGGAAGAGVLGGDGSSKRVEDAKAIGEALDKWSTRCEMKATIEAAVGLARKMLTVDAEMLDADPYLLNARNGVVDLRTGKLMPHAPERMMTKLADVDYVEGARCEAWERAVLVICGGGSGQGGDAGRALAAFLQRWFGYCATGLTREQVFVVHWGDGSNGKSTIMDAVARVLGDYAGTAAPGLMAGGEKDRHPTEIAALAGKRMVTAHETREGVQLREDFVKQATGTDKLVGRFMREDFFEFVPTHKLQLLTNSKPVVKGQDHGIWRRVRLVKYGQRFGSAEDVSAGLATSVRDVGLAEELGREEVLQGVLAWVVRGAVEWFAEGLREPAAVIEAGEAYRMEQDRVRQWALECCELGGAGGSQIPYAEPLTMGMSGLFPSYTSWCRESGYHGLGRSRFVDELTRAFPGLKVVEIYGRGESGARRKITQVQGIRLLPE